MEAIYTLNHETEYNWFIFYNSRKTFAPKSSGCL